MNKRKAQALLMASAINLLYVEEDDKTFEGCCTICCGPCAALKYLRDYHFNYANWLVKSLESDYDWQNEDGTINWPEIEKIWAKRKGCSISNGVYELCIEEETVEETKKCECLGLSHREECSEWTLPI